MLRPWVPLIALGLLLAFAWSYHPSILAYLGGAILVVALLSQTVKKSLGSWRKAKAERRAARLDWKIIDQSMAYERPKRDCERPETLGFCTGRDCLVYEGCDFNIKKPLP